MFNNAGVSSSSGEVPTTFEQMGANAVAFSRALGLKKADILGFSIGGMVAQEIVLQAPDLVRKLILVGTGPRGGQGMESLTQAAGRLFGATYDPPEYVWLAVQFSPSAAGQAAGKAFLKRTRLRKEGRDPEVNDKVSPAQVEAMDKWGVQRDGSYDYLKTIAQPTLVVNGSHDMIMPTVNSFIMEQHSKCAADHLPRRQSRLAAPVSGALRGTRDAVLERVMRCLVGMVFNRRRWSDEFDNGVDYRRAATEGLRGLVTEQTAESYGRRSTVTSWVSC